MRSAFSARVTNWTAAIWRIGTCRNLGVVAGFQTSRRIYRHRVFDTAHLFTNHVRRVFALGSQRFLDCRHEVLDVRSSAFSERPRRMFVGNLQYHFLRQVKILRE